MASPAMRYVTLEEYFALDAQSEIKHEYVHGEIFAMSGGSPNHSRLQVSLTTLLSSQLLNRSCELFSADLRVEVEPGGAYCYPDISISCGTPRFDANNNLENPTLIVEVLSPATERYDRGRKFQLYREIRTLRQYVLVAQDQRLVEVYTRQEHESWRLDVFSAPDAIIRLESVDCSLRVSELYARVELPAAPEGLVPTTPIR